MSGGRTATGDKPLVVPYAAIVGPSRDSRSQVVSKKYVTGSPDINTYRYSAYSNEHKEDEDVPSIMFQYDLSPMTVVTAFESQPFYHFVTNFCAIIGGVFSIIGIVDRILQTVFSGLTKKIL